MLSFRRKWCVTIELRDSVQQDHFAFEHQDPRRRLIPMVDIRQLELGIYTTCARFLV